MATLEVATTSFSTERDFEMKLSPWKLLIESQVKK